MKDFLRTYFVNLISPIRSHILETGVKTCFFSLKMSGWGHVFLSLINLYGSETTIFNVVHNLHDDLIVLSCTKSYDLTNCNFLNYSCMFGNTGS